MLSKSSEYAIRLVFYILSKKNVFIRLKDAADSLHIPYYQLAKVANSLMKGNILLSRTGPRGGVKTNFDPELTTLSQIVLPFESEKLFNRCILGLSVCNPENPCPIHEYWKHTKQDSITLFTSTSIQELFSNVQGDGNDLGRFTL